MKSTNDQPSYKTTIELYLLFCLSSGMLSFGFTESFLASHGCAVGHPEKTFGLAEPTYKKIAAVAHGIPICALCTDDGALGNNPLGHMTPKPCFRLVGRLQVIRTVCRLHSPVPVGRSNVKLSSLKCQDCLCEGYLSPVIGKRRSLSLG